jgi:hippurate hydrolase
MTSSDLCAEAAALAPDLVRLRREIHREPEAGLHLPRTQQRVLSALDGLPLEVTLGRQLSSVVAVLRGAGDGPPVLLRGDMDALPLDETAGVDYASRVPGRMHACGHDLHTAMLAGAARLLAARREQLPGPVIFMFQPGEENDGGARLMIEEGVLEAAGSAPGAAYALHVISAQRAGQFATRAGAITASADELRVTVTGTGGHGAVPAMTRDPIAAASAMVSALQVHIARRANLFDPVVVSVCSFHAGTASNIIPGTAELSGTIRSFSPAAREAIHAGIRQVLADVARAHQVSVSVSIADGYPVAANSAAATRRVMTGVADLFGTDRFTAFAAPSAAAEDFAFVLSRVPGAFVYLGATAAGRDPRTAPFNHAPDAVFDDSVLPDGSALLAALALRPPDGAARTPVNDAGKRAP